MSRFEKGDRGVRFSQNAIDNFRSCGYDDETDAINDLLTAVQQEPYNLRGKIEKYGEQQNNVLYFLSPTSILFTLRNNPNEVIIITITNRSATVNSSTFKNSGKKGGIPKTHARRSERWKRDKEEKRRLAEEDDNY